MIPRLGNRIFWRALTNTNDHEPIRDGNEGSTNRFAARFRADYKKLTCIAAGVLGQMEGAEDIVQQAVAIALDKNERFTSENHFIGWLCSTVKLCALNQCRKTSGRKTIASDPSILSAMQDDRRSLAAKPIHTGTGELLPDQQSFDDSTLQALQSLPEQSRCCLLLRVIENLSYSEIAELMQIPEGTAMSHVHRGKKRLRELLKASREGGDA